MTWAKKLKEALPFADQEARSDIILRYCPRDLFGCEAPGDGCGCSDGKLPKSCADCWNGGVITAEEEIEHIRRAKTAADGDVDEVWTEMIRCKDCAYFSLDVVGMRNGACRRRVTLFYGEKEPTIAVEAVPGPEHYCGYAKRREAKK